MWHEHQVLSGTSELWRVCRCWKPVKEMILFTQSRAGGSIITAAFLGIRGQWYLWKCKPFINNIYLHVRPSVRQRGQESTGDRWSNAIWHCLFSSLRSHLSFLWWFKNWLDWSGQIWAAILNRTNKLLARNINDLLLFRWVLLHIAELGRSKCEWNECLWI